MTSLVPSGKRAFDLDLVDHLGNSFHHVVPGQHPRPKRHQVGHAPAVANAFEHFSGDDSDGFGMIQLQPPRPAPSRHVRRGEDEKLVDFAFGQAHGRSVGADYAAGTGWEVCSRRFGPPAGASLSRGRIRVSVSIISRTIRGTRSDRRCTHPVSRRASGPRSARPAGIRPESPARPTGTGRC